MCSHVLSCTEFVGYIISSSCAHLQAAPDNPILGIVSGLLRLTFPITAAFYLIKITFRLGATKKRDKYALVNAHMQ